MKGAGWDAEAGGGRAAARVKGSELLQPQPRDDGAGKVVQRL